MNQDGGGYAISSAILDATINTLLQQSSVDCTGSVPMNSEEQTFNQQGGIDTLIRCHEQGWKCIFTKHLYAKGFPIILSNSFYSPAGR